MSKLWTWRGLALLGLTAATVGHGADDIARCLAPLFASPAPAVVSRVPAEPVAASPRDLDRLASAQREYLRILKIAPENLLAYRLTTTEAEVYRRPLPQWISPYPKPLRMNPREIRFMQIVASDAMQDGVHSVLENAAEIRAGRTNVDTLPVITPNAGESIYVRLTSSVVLNVK